MEILNLYLLIFSDDWKNNASRSGSATTEEEEGQVLTPPSPFVSLQSYQENLHTFFNQVLLP